MPVYVLIIINSLFDIGDDIQRCALILDAYRLRYLASFVVFDRRIANIQRQVVVFLFSLRENKKTSPIWKRKQLYHPFTYPPICAKDYGRAPSLITRMHQSAKPSLIHSLSQARLGSDIRAERGGFAYPLPRHVPSRAYSVSGSHRPRLSVPFLRGYCLRHSL